MIDLGGKVAIVTGAASGMGAVMAGALLEAGARVVGVDINPSPRVSHAIRADISAPQECERVVAETLARYGGIAILVNNAGVSMAPAVPQGGTGGRTRFWEAVPEGWLKIIAINTGGAFLMARYAAPRMIEAGWGRIINVTTSFDTMIAPGLSAYGGAKAALEANTAVWAKELAGTGVTANILVPGGPTDTAFFPPGFPRDGLLKPELMGPPVQFLASAEADGITGCRFIARDWDLKLPPAEAARKIRTPAAWPSLGVAAESQRK